MWPNGTQAADRNKIVYEITTRHTVSRKKKCIDFFKVTIQEICDKHIFTGRWS